MIRRISVADYIQELQSEGTITGMTSIQDSRSIFLGALHSPLELYDQGKKHIIARYHEVKKETVTGVSGVMKLAYLPKNVEHADLLAHSRVRDYGPQRVFPGSAAVLAMDYVMPRLIGSGSVTLDYVQFCFKVGSPMRLSRSLASKYLGARKHLLRAFFSQPMVKKAGVIHLSRDGRRVGVLRDLEQVVSEEGLPLIRDGGFLRRKRWLER